jgi:hypothetical protein
MWQPKKFERRYKESLNLKSEFYVEPSAEHSWIKIVEEEKSLLNGEEEDFWRIFDPIK